MEKIKDAVRWMLGLWTLRLAAEQPVANSSESDFIYSTLCPAASIIYYSKNYMI